MSDDFPKQIFKHFVHVLPAGGRRLEVHQTPRHRVLPPFVLTHHPLLGVDFVGAEGDRHVAGIGAVFGGLVEPRVEVVVGLSLGHVVHQDAPLGVLVELVADWGRVRVAMER